MYHDSNIMPFPHGSYTSLQDAISASPLNDLNQAEFLEEYGISEVDKYWDAYGQASDEDRSDIIRVMDNNQDGTEDSYWAQYAAVQGSGDSTQPSPPHIRRKLHAGGDINPHTSFCSRFPEGPSPGRLADRLNAISPRPSSPLFFNDSESTTPSPPSADSTTVLDTDCKDPVILNMKDLSLGAKVKGGAEDVEAALRQSIRGVLGLWKAGRRKCFVTPPAGQQEENELFLRIVRETVEET